MGGELINSAKPGNYRYRIELIILKKNMLNSRVHIIPSPTKGGVQVQVKDAIVTSHMAFGSQGFGSHGLGMSLS